MILAEIDLTATKILTPGFDIGRLPRGTAGRASRSRRETPTRAPHNRRTREIVRMIVS